jgi:hypothetical protein
VWLMVETDFGVDNKSDFLGSNGGLYKP